MERFAIYFSPGADSPLNRLAAAWLGRNAFEGGSVQLPPLNGLSQGLWSTATSDPRLYGFHATLKAPFRIASSGSREALKEALRRFAESRYAFDAPPLRVEMLSSFLALVPSEECANLDELAAACVKEFDSFRASPSEEELARRRSAGLSPAQLENLNRWGYPYVMGDWRFHMTLTSSLDAGTGPPVKVHLEQLFAPHCRERLRVDAIYLFEQPSVMQPFHVGERFPLR